MIDDHQIIARPFDPDIVRHAKSCGLRWCDLLFVSAGILTLLAAGTLILFGAIWAFAA
jgi:hypothetical protein